MTIQSQLSRYVPKAATTPAQLKAMGVRAWQDEGILVVRLDQMDGMAQAMIESIARQAGYGKRND